MCDQDAATNDEPRRFFFLLIHLAKEEWDNIGLNPPRLDEAECSFWQRGEVCLFFLTLGNGLIQREEHPVVTSLSTDIAFVRFQETTEQKRITCLRTGGPESSSKQQAASSERHIMYTQAARKSHST